MSQEPSRLRVPPRERFRGKERVFDLGRAFADLPGESVVREGQTQKTLYRYGPTTTAIFAFEKGATLDAYRVEGQAILHVLAGRLKVKTEAESYELGAGQILLLDPDVEHSLIASEPTRLLLTVVILGAS
jgi:quercetin dioxygenase-like cupin family protein